MVSDHPNYTTLIWPVRTNTDLSPGLTRLFFPKTKLELSHRQVGGKNVNCLSWMNLTEGHPITFQVLFLFFEGLPLPNVFHGVFPRWKTWNKTRDTFGKCPARRVAFIFVTHTQKVIHLWKPTAELRVLRVFSPPPHSNCLIIIASLLPRIKLAFNLAFASLGQRCSEVTEHMKAEIRLHMQSRKLSRW